MIQVAVFHAHPAYRLPVRETLRMVRGVLRMEGRGNADVSIILVEDRRMRQLHKKYLHLGSTTDVLSFPLSESEDVVAGEVYVNIEQARRQAPLFGATVRREIYRLIIHGVLHLIGYDDRTPAQRTQMTRREDRYLG